MLIANIEPTEQTGYTMLLYKYPDYFPSKNYLHLKKCHQAEIYPAPQLIYFDYLLLLSLMISTILTRYLIYVETHAHILAVLKQ